MNQDAFTIRYQKQFIATSQTDIYFYQEKIDLKKLFFSDGTTAKAEASGNTSGTATSANAEASIGRGETVRKKDYGLACKDTSGTSTPAKAEASDGRGDTARTNNYGLASNNTSGTSTSAKTEASSGRGDTARKKDYGLACKDTSGTARRLFATDTNVAALPALKNFVALFGTDGKAAGTYDGKGAAKGSALVVLKAGEKYKDIKSVLKIAAAALDRSFTRKDIFCAIGGGVLTDMTAFAASIYKRGAVCEFVPTTLLAMVDAAAGGKTGCDFGQYKNMIGSFFPARTLYVFPEFVQTLSGREYRSGFAEAFKTALLYDKKMYSAIRANKEKILARDKDFVFAMIRSCVTAKARVVQKDMTEKNIRMQLNLGHTFGHALETCAGLGKIAHGNAVAWGIGRAAQMSFNLGLCSEEYKNEIFDALKAFGWDTGAKPKRFCPEGGAKQLLDAMRRDKKNSSGKIRLVLQRGVCDTVTVEADDKDILKCL